MFKKQSKTNKIILYLKYKSTQQNTVNHNNKEIK
jgi:hypothetical protein